MALVLQIEAEKGSSHVVAELACDSAAMFKSSIEFGTYAEFKGIVLLLFFSPALPLRRSTPLWSAH